jgi:arylsulfatase A-like enzyme
MATTLPSHLSMLTGLYPHQHGMEANRRAAQHRFEPSADVIPISVLLRDAGWQTAAFVSSKVLGPATGVGAGFTTYDTPTGLERAGEETTDRALAWLRAQESRRFLLWIHLFDVHDPNIPPAPFDALHVADERIERLLDERKFRPEVIARLPRPGLQRMFRKGSGDAAPVVVDRAAMLDLLDRYDGDVSYVDACVGRILDALDELGLAQRTVVAVVSDHGQSLGSNDWLGHGRITDENVLAAMLVRFPGGVAQQPQRIPNVVSLLDLFPTILARFDAGAELARYLEQCEGEDVLSGSFARPFALCQQTTRQAVSGDRRYYALILQRGRYDSAEGGEPTLRDAHGDTQALAARCARDLDALLGRRRAAAQTRQDAREGRELEESLRALGYAGDDE